MIECGVFAKGATATARPCYTNWGKLELSGRLLGAGFLDIGRSHFHYHLTLLVSVTFQLSRLISLGASDLSKRMGYVTQLYFWF